MKKLLSVVLLALFLQGCGGPGVVAYTRGILIEKEADKELSNNGRIDNKTRAKYFQAIEQFNSALHFSPEHNLSYYHRGVCRARIGQYDAAERDFSQCVKLQPSSPDAWRDRAMVYKELQQFDRAVQDYNTADKLKPGDERVYFGRSYCKLYAGDSKGALEDAEKAAALDPTPSNYCAIATAQRALGNIGEMDGAFAKAVQANPHRIQTYQTRGFANFITARYPLAFRDFQTALEGSDYEGDDTPYAVLFGAFAARFQNHEVEARQLLDRGVKQLNVPTEIDKNAHNAMVSQDWPQPAIQYFHGDINEEKFLRAAQGDNSKLTELNCYLGLNALAKHDKKSALRYFDWVAKNGRKDYVETEVARAQLKSLTAKGPAALDRGDAHH